MPRMLDHNRACLDRAWRIIHALICLLQVQIPNLFSDRKHQWHLLHLTRVAEAIVRRWLVLKVCVDGNRVDAPMACASDRKNARLPARSQSDPAAVLTINERDPRAPVFIYHHEQDGEPAYYLLTHPTASGIPIHGAPIRALNLTHLKRRCEALVAIISQPAVHISRMARWLARAAARHKRKVCKCHPFRVGWPPGASRRQRRHDPERQNMLLYLDQLARDALSQAVPA